MRNLPPQIIHVLRLFERLFSERVWEWVQILLVGAILALGKRTVTAVLRVMGLSDERQVPELSPGTQSCGLVATRGQPHPVAPVGASVCAA